MCLPCGLGVSPGKTQGRPMTLEQYDMTKSVSVYSNGIIVLLDNLSLETVCELILEENISGIVAAKGGICCHGAILSREANLPCIVNVSDINELEKYSIIQIDGTSGDIEVPM